MTEVTAVFDIFVFVLFSLLLTFSVIAHIAVDITIFYFVHMVANVTIIIVHFCQKLLAL